MRLRGVNGELTGAPRDLTGALLVDKPSGPTSHDVVAFARRLLHTSRVGHTGTLDPLATGLLVLLIGPATRLARFVSADEKEYLADIRLGVATPTYDAQSLPADVRYPISDVRYPTRGEIEAALARFRGSFLQTPPQYSAKKIAGIAAYSKARKNETVVLEPAAVTVRELELLNTSDIGDRASDIGRGLVRLRVAATAGFYVRSLAHDLGQALGCGAHLEALRRTRAGRFRVEDAASLDTLQAAGPAAPERILPVSELLGHLPAVAATEAGLRRAENGNPLRPGDLDDGAGVDDGAKAGSGAFVRVLGGGGETMAVAEARPDGLLHPVVVLR